MTAGVIDVDNPLELEDVGVSFGSTRALHGLCVRVHPHSVHALLGPNGAGKSTAIATSVGLLTPDHGHVRVFGCNPVSQHTLTGALTGVMLQDGGLPMAAKPLDVLENLSRLYRNPANYRELAHRLGIDTFANRTIRRLSGGQRQRVGLAAALIGRPRLVFLDEPTAGLDPQARLVVFDVITELRDAGVAVVLTTHDMDDAAELADFVTVIDHGEVIASGTVSELTGGGHATLRIQTTRALTSDDVDALNRFGHVEHTGECVRITGEFTTESVHTITGVLVDLGLEIRTLSLTTRSLDDVFLDLTGRTLRS